MTASSEVQPEESMPTVIDLEMLRVVEESICLPLSLIINFSLFQYLVVTFYGRRSETRVRLLFLVAFLSFASLMPFSYPNVEIVHDLNDISEVSTVMTFLLQINMMARRVGKKIRIRSLVACAWIGEALVVLGFLVLLSNFVQVFDTSIDIAVVEEMDNVYENAATLFVCVFRFYFLGLVKGYRSLWRTHKLEMFWYFLFLTNEYPFMVLEAATGVSWEHVQGAWNRIAIVLCLSSTLRAKFVSSMSSKATRSTAGGMNSRASVNPSTAGDFDGDALGPTEARVTKQSHTLRPVAVHPLGPTSPTRPKARP